MAQAEALIDTLKTALKQNRMTYAEVALRLGMSEANVKRLFASKRFSLERLEQVCQLMQMELGDLFQLHESSLKKISQLTRQQEQELVQDSKLLLVAVSVRNRLSFEEILQHYELTESECIRCLARLDKLKIIELLPGNRIKLRIDENFSWIPNGPIEKFYEQQIQQQFLKSSFSGAMEQRLFLFGLLSDASNQVILNKLKMLATDFAQLHRQDAGLPMDKRHSVGCVLAMRPWDLDMLQAMTRSTK